MSIENPNQQNRKPEEETEDREMMQTKDGSMADVTGMSPEEKREAYEA